MKKILFLMAMAIMALGFTACTENEDNPTPEVEFLNFNPLLQWGCSIAGGRTATTNWNTGPTRLKAGTNGIGRMPKTKSPSSTSSRPRTARTCAT